MNVSHLTDDDMGYIPDAGEYAYESGGFGEFACRELHADTYRMRVLIITGECRYKKPGAGPGFVLFLEST